MSLLFSLLFIDCNSHLAKCVYVDVIELNHVYNRYGEAGCDQVVLWNWKQHKDGTVKRKPLGFVVLDRKLHREQLTEEELIEKNIEFQKQWDKKFGSKNYRPNYNPEFIYTMYCPYYDHYRGLWCFMLHKNKSVIRVYSVSYTETHTQYDVEVHARSIWADYDAQPKKDLMK